ncbi:MAG: hypothetical protein ACO1PI_12525 [Bacteroidota bacterium]
MLSEINYLIGGRGTELITASVTGRTYQYLVINDDVTFTTLTGVDGTNIKTDLNIGSNIIRQGMIIRARGGELIKDVTIASGSVFGII